MGQKDLLESRQRYSSPPSGPVGVGRPSWWVSRGREPSRRAGKGLEALSNGRQR